MFLDGNITVFVSNMDTAVNFYTETLGLKLKERYGDHWATVQADGLAIGLHPASSKYPAPGTRGSMMIGLETDESIGVVMRQLQSKGVTFRGPVVDDDAGKFVDFSDPDGNGLYLWQTVRA